MKSFRLLILPFVLLVSGCASISVLPGTSESTEHAPDHIYVDRFSTNTGDFRVDREDAELAEFKSNLQLMMVTGITVDLTKRLIPATASDAKHPAHHEHAWLIRGEFVRVYQGSRLLRGAIGFGAGATKLVTLIRVYDVEHGLHDPFLTFTTTGGSNAEPGAITSLTTDPLTLAIEAVTGGAGNVAHGVTEDTKRTAREITAELSDYLYKRGWIPKDKWVKPKIYND